MKWCVRHEYYKEFDCKIHLKTATVPPTTRANNIKHSMEIGEFLFQKSIAVLKVGRSTLQIISSTILPIKTRKKESFFRSTIPLSNNSAIFNPIGLGRISSPRALFCPEKF